MANKVARSLPLSFLSLGPMKEWSLERALREFISFLVFRLATKADPRLAGSAIICFPIAVELPSSKEPCEVSFYPRYLNDVGRQISENYDAKSAVHL